MGFAGISLILPESVFKNALIPAKPNTGTRRFVPPDPGEQLDWVLVLDDAAKNYPPPGQVIRP